MVVAGELRVLGEQRAFVRPVEVGFQRQIALGLGEPEDRVHRSEQFQVVALVLLRPFQNPPQRLDRRDQRLAGVADDESADGGADDDEKLERLPKDAQMAAAGDVTADDAGENDDQAAKEKHSLSV